MYDAYTFEDIDSQLAIQAKQEELEFFKRKNVRLCREFGLQARESWGLGG